MFFLIGHYNIKMRILKGLVIVYQLCLLSPKIECGLVGDFMHAINPLKILKNIDNIFTTVAPPSGSTVKTKLVSVEETVFHVAPFLQSLFQPDDPVAQLNYIVCPLSAISLLAQVLIGTHGTFHRYISSFLELDTRAKRQVQVFELTKDDLYDKKLYHSAFHWKLKRLMTSIKSSKSATAVFENAFIYNKNIQLVEHFPKYLKDYYGTEIFPVNPNEIDAKVLECIQYNGARRNPISIDNRENRAVLCNKFKFVSTWDTPFKDELTEGPFKINPFQEIKIQYLQTTIKNATCLYTNLFALAVIPLKDKEFQLYVMVPTDKQTPIRKFSESLRDFEFFKTRENKYEPVNMELEMPKIFPYVAELDLMKPIRDDFRERGYTKLNYIELNAAAKNLELTNSIQHLEISISNEGQQLKSPYVQPSEYQTLHESIVQPLGKQTMVNISLQHRIQQRDLSQQPFGSVQWPQGLAQQPPGFLQPSQQPSGFAQQQQQFPETYGQSGMRDIKFKVDSPFLFFIMHEKTKMVLVWGSISDPTKL